MRGIAALCFVYACAMHAAAVAAAEDSSQTRKVQAPPKDAVDYILAVPSAALRAPFRVLGAIASGPVILVEGSPLPYAFERLFAFDVPWGIYPVFGYKSRTGLVLGAAYFTKNAAHSGIPLGVKGTYSTNTYRYASVRVGDRDIFDSTYGFILEGGWRADTRERFYGIGPSTSSDDRSNYGYRGAFGTLAGYRSFGDGGEVSVFGGLRRVEPEDGRLNTIIHDRDSIAERFDGQDLYGLFETLDLYNVGLSASYDWRERPSSPLGGGTAGLIVSYTSGSGIGDTSVGFWRVHAEASHFLELFNERVIGVRATAEHIEPDDGTRVPFYELARLGGSQFLRGYKTGRFRDLGYVAFSAEYRWPLWRRIDALLFTDHGRVFHDLSEDFEFSNFKSSYGGGMRIWNNAGHLSLLAAKGTEEWSFYINFGDSF
jgi:outer membrane protein assembly factor BamA